MNEGDAEGEIPYGAMVAGFHKGKWKDEVCDDGEAIQFTLENSLDVVWYNNKVVTLGQAIASKRLTMQADEAKIAYHEMRSEPTDGDPTAFRLDKKQDVYFALQPMKVQVKEERWGHHINNSTHKQTTHHEQKLSRRSWMGVAAGVSYGCWWWRWWVWGSRSKLR